MAHILGFMMNARTATILRFDVDEAHKAEAETTHEQFVHAVRAAVAGRVVERETRERLLAAKLVYGGGPAGVRGICYYGAWQNGTTHDFLEIAALGEESYVQLAGTTIHELAHSLAGHGCGHGPEWKKGLRRAGPSGRPGRRPGLQPRALRRGRLGRDRVTAAPVRRSAAVHPGWGSPGDAAPLPARDRHPRRALTRHRLGLAPAPLGVRLPRGHTRPQGPGGVRHLGRDLQPLWRDLQQDDGGPGVMAFAVRVNTRRRA